MGGRRKQATKEQDDESEENDVEMDGNDIDWESDYKNPRIAQFSPDKKIYIVEGLLKHREGGKEKEYLVKWDGGETTWEPARHISPLCIKEYWSDNDDDDSDASDASDASISKTKRKSKRIRRSD